MSERPWHKRFHGDALMGMMSLSLEERGAYQTLLDLMYDRGGPMPDNERLLAGYMGVSLRKWRTIRDGLIQKGKISLTDEGFLSNSRVISELENSSKTSRKRAENGSKGGEKKAENRKKDNENSDGDENLLEQKPSYTRVTRGQRPEEEEDKLLPPDARAENGNGEDDIPGPKPPANGKHYAFAGNVIRLNRPDFDLWRQRYHAIPDIEAELGAIDDWLRDKPDKHASWFVSVSGMLAKKHAEMIERARANEVPEYVPRREHSDEEREAARQRLIARGIFPAKPMNGELTP